VVAHRRQRPRVALLRGHAARPQAHGADVGLRGQRSRAAQTFWISRAVECLPTEWM
jgi:hypothetical protein